MKVVLEVISRSETGVPERSKRFVGGEEKTGGELTPPPGRRPGGTFGDKLEGKLGSSLLGGALS